MTWLIVAIILAVGLLVLVLARRRSRRAPDGIENFRRHTDALVRFPPRRD